MKKQSAEAQNVSPGGFAITVFIGSAVYLILINLGWQTLLTIKAVIFLLLGVFFSVLLVGVPFHLLRMRMQKSFFGVGDTPLSTSKIKQLKTATTFLLTVQVILTFFATKLAYSWYFS